MNTRQTTNNAIAQLNASLGAGVAAGVSYEQALAALNRAYQPAMVALPMHVQSALRTPTTKASVQVIEAIEADAITALRHWPGHVAAHCDMGAVGRAADTMYVRDKTRREFQRDVVASRAFLSSTQHNLGVDIVEFVEFDVDDAAVVRLTQQKIGKTGIHDGVSKSGENRSMRHIADKLERAGELVATCVEEEFDMPVKLLFDLDTASPVNAPARSRASRRGITINDATDLWNDVWPAPIKAALVEMYGTEARAKGFGLTL